MTSLLCTDWEVRAWLDGRKREFRRPMKGVGPSWQRPIEGSHCYLDPHRGFGTELEWRPGSLRQFFPCPYAPGSRLCVKETWKHSGFENQAIYKATSNFPLIGPPWRSPAVMPQWASRLTLLVTACRAERVQEIDVDGCIAEGIETGIPRHLPSSAFSLKQQFVLRWDSRYGKKPGLAWADNPWVWVTTTEVEREG